MYFYTGKRNMISMNRDWLRKKIKQAGLTQEQLAVKIGMRVPAISELYKGGRELSLNEGVKLAQAIGCSLEDIAIANKGGTPTKNDARRVAASHGYILINEERMAEALQIMSELPKGERPTNPEGMAHVLALIYERKTLEAVSGLIENKGNGE